MSTYVGEMRHPSGNGLVKKIYKGFSWPIFFFGMFYLMYKSMWKWTVIAVLAALFTCFASWLIFPFITNRQYAKMLLEDGWTPDDAVKEYLGITPAEKPSELLLEKTAGA